MIKDYSRVEALLTEIDESCQTSRALDSDQQSYTICRSCRYIKGGTFEWRILQRLAAQKIEVASLLAGQKIDVALRLAVKRLTSPYDWPPKD